MSLTDKQDKFARNVADGKTLTQSAIDAGYSEKTAYSIGSENMKKPDIKRRVEELQEQKVSLLQRRFIGMADSALQKLYEVLVDEDTPPQTKTNTAKILLDYAGFKPVEKQETQISGGLSVTEQAEVIGKYLSE